PSDVYAVCDVFGFWCGPGLTGCVMRSVADELPAFFVEFRVGFSVPGHSHVNQHPVWLFVEYPVQRSFECVKVFADFFGWDHVPHDDLLTCRFWCVWGLVVCGFLECGFRISRTGRRGIG